MTNIKSIWAIAIFGMALCSATAMAESRQVRTQNDNLVIPDAPALSTTSGGDSIQDQRANVSQGATLGDNQLTAGDTGSNAVSSGAFTNMAGIAHVIQNSGNNVIIQDSTTFNVQFVPGSL